MNTGTYPYMEHTSSVYMHEGCGMINEYHNNIHVYNIVICMHNMQCKDIKIACIVSCVNSLHIVLGGGVVCVCKAFTHY